jgi:hypothetical protein
MNIAGSQLVLDANSGKYKARVYAKVNGGKDIAATFKVNIPALANNAGVVGMVAGQTTNVDIDGRKTSYANINLKFAPPCTWTDKDVTATWYDDDNNPPQAGIQPAEFLIWVVETDKTTGASSKIQLTSSKLVENGSTNTFYPRAGQGTGTFTFRAKDNKKYDWVWSRIYDNNALQFSLPFDSINYTTVCPPPVAPTLTPSVLGAPTVNAGAPATFTLHDKVVNFSAPNKTYTYNVNYHYDNDPYAAIPAAISGVFAPRNKTLTISSDVNRDITPDIVFPAAALAGHDKVCVQFNIANGGGMTVTGNPAEYCTSIVTPGTYTVTASQADYEKGTGGAGASVVYNLIRTSAPCNAADTVIWKPGTAAARSVAVPIDCANPPAATIDTFTDTASAATLDAQPVGLYTNGGAYKANIVSINGVASARRQVAAAGRQR